MFGPEEKKKPKIKQVVIDSSLSGVILTTTF